MNMQADSSISETHHPHSDSASMLAIVVLGIVVTAFALVCYFVFVNRCCSNWRHVNLLRWYFSVSRPRQDEDPFIAFSPTMWNRGLDDSVIKGIPAMRYSKPKGKEKGVLGCVVCLNEFQQGDPLKVLPVCSHAFHTDCIDTWLESNANCPLCRSSISGTKYSQGNHIVAPSSSPQDSQILYNISDEDFVVIEFGEDGEALPQRRRDRNESREAFYHCRSPPPPPPPPPRQLSREKEHKVGDSKTRGCHHVAIMGDECIDVRRKYEQFSVQPIRRSFSLDSAADRQLYLTIEEIIQDNMHVNEVRGISDYHDNRSGRRTFFPFCHGRGSGNAVLPLENEI